MTLAFRCRIKILLLTYLLAYLLPIRVLAVTNWCWQLALRKRSVSQRNGASLWIILENVLLKRAADEQWIRKTTDNRRMLSYTQTHARVAQQHVSNLTKTAVMYTVSQKNWAFLFEHNFRKYRPILTLFFYCCRCKLSAHKQVIEFPTSPIVCCCTTWKMQPHTLLHKNCGINPQCMP